MVHCAHYDYGEYDRTRDDFRPGTFPDGFIWSTATASYQIEGAWNVDGKGESIWDRFSHTPGKVDRGDTGDVACDSHNKYREDVQLMKAMGLKYYRFSLSWPRIFPDGTVAGGVNQAGVDYYNNVIDELLANGITPMVTLYHWDLPQALQDRYGGWVNEEIVEHYDNYATFAFQTFGDRVKYWLTFNEPMVLCSLGYTSGEHAPGIHDPTSVSGLSCGHTLLKAHARAWHTYNTTFRQLQGGKVGIALSLLWAEPRDPDLPADVSATDRAMQMINGWFAQPIFGDGDYPNVIKETEVVERGIETEGSNLSGVSAKCSWEEMEESREEREESEETVRQRITPHAITFVSPRVMGAIADESHPYASRGPWLQKSKSISIPTVSFLFYAATDGQGTIQPVLENNRLVAITGQTEELGKFRMSFPKVSRKNITYHHLVSYSPRLDLLKSSVEHGMRRLLFNKTRIQYGLAGDLIKRSNMPDLKANVLVHQVTLEVPCVLEVVFESESFTSRNTRLVGMELTRELEKYKVAFDEKFENTFGLNRRGYTEKNLRFAKAAVSNMVGGIGYFRGKSLVQSPYNEEPVEYWEAPLYTAVPSRSFFPRGFLWDEGFHQLLISKWDTAISKEILSHWLDLMNMEGWIPREQILGSEARSKVPAEFVVQKNQNANPPTLFLPIQSLMKDLASNRSEEDILLLKRMFPRLKTWYNWFNTSQLGNEPSSYRWRGRDPGANKNQQLNPLTLTSGLDDYPRASHPSDSERHIDLRCWMALASGVMADIAKVIGEPGEEYEATHKLLTDNALLEKLHWSPEKQLFSDYGKHTKGVVLEREKVPLPPPPKPGMRRQPVPKGKMYRVLKGEQPTDKFVNSFGYVSLFPFLLQIVDPKSPKLGKILTDLKNPQLLWTKYGLRSLAKTDPLYMKYNTEHDPPYWRGQIWINMNFLAVRALHHYSNIKGPYQSQAADTYKELRRSLIHNLYVEYERSGFIWENYSDVNGHGKGCHPFTGWSSLIVLIMAEKY
uniref:mannosyl-oligosaccharide glucosidase n=1 Tax=Branchiostoma floridae TaxID=7739 RepID=C3Y5C2_BRAFL|eukprot:XP_002608159.1 hypothetical protein BRAFLDRAFT_125874 [Branchiostoma floridae]